MWKLGNYEIKGKVVLAPMAGITSEGIENTSILLAWIYVLPRWFPTWV
jgi:hypothetical protein